MVAAGDSLRVTITFRMLQEALKTTVKTSSIYSHLPCDTLPQEKN
jgi:hypothetical protein